MYQIKAMLSKPSQMRYSKHYDQLMRITTELCKRVQAGSTTWIAKVPAHQGVHGNEMADKGAKCAAMQPDDNKWVDPSNNNPRASYYWIGLRQPTQSQSNGDDGTFVTTAYNLVKNIKDAISARAAVGFAKVGVYAQGWMQAYPTLDEHYSTLVMASKRATFSNRMTIFRGWWGLLWNKKRANMMRVPYLKGPTTTPAMPPNDTCPLCPKPDSSSHILGGCLHPDMKKQYILRHDEAVRMVCEAILQGSLGGCYTIMDAGRRVDLPHGVADKRMAEWLLPGIPEAQRRTMRPDILLIPNVTEANYPTSIEDRSNYTVHIIEVGYCADTQHNLKQHEKAQQHQQLADMLIEAGWKVQYTTLQALSLGYCGAIRKDFTKALQSVGIEPKDASNLCTRLHWHAVDTCCNIVKVRRLLERTTMGSGGCCAQQPP
jgi:hypothetical protein